MKRIEMPPDFRGRADESLDALATIYRVSKTTVRNWREQLGISVPRGAPKGNKNARPRKKGADDPAEIRTCLSCTAKNCRGRCAKVH